MNHNKSHAFSYSNRMMTNMDILIRIIFMGLYYSIRKLLQRRGTHKIFGRLTSNRSENRVFLKVVRGHIIIGRQRRFA